MNRLSKWSVGIGFALIVIFNLAAENLRIPVNFFKISARTARTVLDVVLFIGIALLLPGVYTLTKLKQFAVMLTGAISGLIGSALGFLPFLLLHGFLISLTDNLTGDTSKIISMLADGIPLPMLGAITVLPIGGIVTGMVGTSIGLLRHLKNGGALESQKWVALRWGLVFGFFFSSLFTYYNQ